MTQAFFFTALFALGWVLNHSWASRLGWGARTLLAFPVGMSAWVVLGMLTLGVGLPFTTLGMTLTLGLVFIGAVLIQLVRRTLSPRSVFALTATIPAFLGVAYLLTLANHAEFSFDSHFIIMIAKALAFEGGIAGRLGEQLAEWGAFQLLFHSAAELYGTSYFWSGSTLVGLHLTGILVWLTARLLGGRQARWPHVLWGLSAAIGLCSVHFILFHFFYIHTNFPAALFLLIFVGCGWCWLREDEEAWLPPVFIAAAAFSLQRTETLLPAVLFLLLMLSEQRRFGTHQLRLTFGFAAVVAFWQFVALRHIGEGTTILSPSKVYLLLAVLGGYLALVCLIRFSRLGDARRWLRPAAVVALSVATLVTALSKPAHMGESLYSTFANLFLGFWGAAWFMVLALAVIGLLLPKLEVGRFVGAGLVTYALLILALAFMRDPYANRWPDSANRMFVHLFPLTVLFFAVRYGLPLFQLERSSLDQNHSSHLNPAVQPVSPA